MQNYAKLTEISNTQSSNLSELKVSLKKLGQDEASKLKRSARDGRRAEAFGSKCGGELAW